MFVKVKRNVLGKFMDSLDKQMIYNEAVKALEGNKEMIVLVDCESPREAFYVGRWVGRNCSTDEVLIVDNPLEMGLG